MQDLNFFLYGDQILEAGPPEFFIFIFILLLPPAPSVLTATHARMRVLSDDGGRRGNESLVVGQLRTRLVRRWAAHC